jgi:hypothetical protein
VLQPRARQAEHFSNMSGVSIVTQSQAAGGATVGSISNGNWIAFTPYALSNATSVTVRVARTGGTGSRTIQVRAGSPSGTLMGTANVPTTGSSTRYTNVTVNLTNRPAGTTTLYLRFTGPTGSQNLFFLDSFTFVSTG